MKLHVSVKESEQGNTSQLKKENKRGCVDLKGRKDDKNAV